MANYWASLNSILPLADTVEPSLPAREINLKACATEIRTRNLPAYRGLNPGSSGRPFRSVHTVSQPTELPRQVRGEGVIMTLCTVYVRGGPRKTWKDIVDKDVNDLHLKQSDNVYCSKWREMTAGYWNKSGIDNDSMSQWCGLRPSVLGQDQSETRPKNRSWSWFCSSDVVLWNTVCYARCHNNLEECNNFSNTIYSFSILCLEHHYHGDQQWLLLT